MNVYVNYTFKSSTREKSFYKIDPEPFMSGLLYEIA